VAAVCHVNYAAGPIPQIVDALKHIWPDGKWMNSSHPFLRGYGGTGKDISMPIPYNEFVWGAGALYNPDGGGQPRPRYPRAWMNGAKEITVGNPRYGVGFMMECLRPGSALANHRFTVEAAVQGGLRGIGRPGGDSWPLPIGKGGKMDVLFDAFKGVGPGESTVALFSPGPDGAAFNARMEVFREGVQTVEAIIFLQRAVESKAAAGELAKRIEDLLDERARYYLRAQEASRAGTRWRSLECSDWQGRDDRLFALCAEVARTK